MSGRSPAYESSTEISQVTALGLKFIPGEVRVCSIMLARTGSKRPTYDIFLLGAQTIESVGGSLPLALGCCGNVRPPRGCPPPRLAPAVASIPATVLPAAGG